MNKIIREERLNSSSVAQSVKKSGDFKTLLTCGFIEYQKAVSGGGSYFVKNKEKLKKYFTDKFPKQLHESFTADANVGTFRNTKIGKRISQNIILVRGFKNIQINDKIVDLGKFTKDFGAFSAQVNTIKTENICIVENLDSFLQAEKIMNKNTVFIHPYGGLSKSVVKKLNSNEIWVFPDYDYKGLQNYLMVKSIFPDSQLFYPKDYENLFKKYSRSIKTKNGKEQNPHKTVQESNDPLVCKIRTDIYQTKRFLEQQALFQND
ncbi:Wadjet anti-phage system protein JetD domain-containing protein [Tenacibaculum ovolyticum]|uniref:Wadjet anti-phage system protein JetD domain-containing protein n=1 Tax=Tenacibaculum ovolyticum TaxID=104270 RepID=UPI001E5A5097|nr:Wadjet anti-phage system protein JetD domain-containing protein [Tenacibaculum ovolyticum]